MQAEWTLQKKVPNARSSQRENSNELREMGETDQKQATVIIGSKKSDDMVLVIHEIALAGKKSLLDEYNIL